MKDGMLVEATELPADDAPEPVEASADGYSAEDLEPTIVLGRE